MKAEEESNENQTVYWVMPRYAQLFKEEIMQILNKENMALCKNKTLKKFSATFLSKLLSYANSKNIKQLIVRTKV